MRPLGPSLLLKGPLSGVEGAGRGGAGLGGGSDHDHEMGGMPELTVDDLLVALERDTVLGRNSMVWRLHNRLLLEREGGGGRVGQQQLQQPQEGMHAGVG